MIAFAPGELSSVAGPVPGPKRNFVDDPNGLVANSPEAPISSYNFADLPCPPRSVMVILQILDLQTFKSFADVLVGRTLVQARVGRTVPSYDSLSAKDS